LLDLFYIKIDILTEKDLSNNEFHGQNFRCSNCQLSQIALINKRRMFDIENTNRTIFNITYENIIEEVKRIYNLQKNLHKNFLVHANNNSKNDNERFCSNNYKVIRSYHSTTLNLYFI